METASNHLRDASNVLGRGGCLDTTRFIPELSWQSFSWWNIGAVGEMQMYYNEFRSYPGAEMQESTCSERTCDSWSISPRVLEATRSGCCVLGFLMCKLLITILTSSMCLA